MAFDYPQRNIKKDYEHLSTDDICQMSIHQSLPYAILALNIHGSLNIGNMMRTAHLCGCRRFVIFGRRHFDRRSAVGVMNYIDIERVQGLVNPKADLTRELTDIDYVFDRAIFVEYIQQNNYLPIFIEQDECSIEANLPNIAGIFKETGNLIPIFIYGNEHFGIPKNILDTREQFARSYTIELRQMGAIQSYNVSNSCAIVSYLISLVLSSPLS